MDGVGPEQQTLKTFEDYESVVSASRGTFLLEAVRYADSLGSQGENDLCETADALAGAANNALIHLIRNGVGAIEDTQREVNCFLYRESIVRKIHLNRLMRGTDREIANAQNEIAIYHDWPDETEKWLDAAIGKFDEDLIKDVHELMDHVDIARDMLDAGEILTEQLQAAERKKRNSKLKLGAAVGLVLGANVLAIVYAKRTEGKG